MAADTLAVPFPVHCRHWPTCAAQTWTCRLLPDRTEQCSPFTSCRFGLRCMYYTTCCLLISALKFTYSLNSLNGLDALFNLHVETACWRSRCEITPKGSLWRGFWNMVYSGCAFPKGKCLHWSSVSFWLCSKLLYVDGNESSVLRCAEHGERICCFFIFYFFIYNWVSLFDC